MSFTLRIRQFKQNPLLERKQFVIDVTHPDTGTLPLLKLVDHLSKLYKVHDSKCIFLTGFRTKFGGGRSRGFGVIYDNINAAKNFERKFRLYRAGILEKPEKPVRRRTKKDIKNERKGVRGTDKKAERKRAAREKGGK